jgi:5-methylcytosine-specific restriction endonuclease McrA
LSKGGAHTYANTQCLCRKCNSDKSDTVEHGD